MSVINTPKLAIHTYEEGENPGAGSQTVKGGGGLNDNWLIIDDALGTQHGTAGTHNNDILSGANLIGTGGSNVADGATLEFSAATGAKVLRVKDSGITKAKLYTDVADNVTIEKHSTNGLQLIALGVTGDKLKQTGGTAVVDESTIEFSSNKMRVKDDGITAPKISHDNNRTKFFMVATLQAVTSLAYAYVNGSVMSANFGVPMPRAGSITRIQWDDGNSIAGQSFAYGTETFTQGQRIVVRIISGGGSIEVLKSGTVEFTYAAPAYAPAHVVLEIEFDD